mmetsp:Transcript_9344/g.13636  ORF Transcript_9344/g.13636 Transcript_9344/m.13636 type:complete len:1041 (+) Transcript_9344:52-3174(+)
MSSSFAKQAQAGRGLFSPIVRTTQQKKKVASSAAAISRVTNVRACSSSVLQSSVSSNKLTPLLRNGSRSNMLGSTLPLGRNGSVMRNVPSLCYYSSLGEPIDSSKKAWQVEDNEEIQRVTEKAMIHELTQKQIQTIESTVPWFLDQMPASYFRQVPWETRMSHIKAISAVRDADMDLDLNLTSYNAETGEVTLTCIRPDVKPGRLLSMAKDLPWIPARAAADFASSDDELVSDDEFLALKRVLVFSADDGTMGLNLFTFGPSNNEVTPLARTEKTGDLILQYAEALQKGEFLDEDGHLKPCDLFERQALIEYMNRCEEKYLQGADPRRFLVQRKMFDVVSGTEGMDVYIEQADTSGKYLWVDIAVANSLPQVALVNSCRALFHEKLNIHRTHLDIVSDGRNGSVALLRMVVSPFDSKNPTPELLERLTRQLKRMKWLDPVTIDLAMDKHPGLGIRQSETITGFCSLAHAIMAKQNAVVYSKSNILELMTRKAYLNYVVEVTNLFLQRFHPVNPLSDEQLQEKTDVLRQKVESDVEDATASEILFKFIDIVRYTLRTNIYLHDRYSLGLRLDPQVMVAEGEAPRELPYGVIFAHGRRFNAFQVRFRDIARGGLRLVTPQSPEQMALESARQYDECYGLASAQQLKNKDIPEGGSKAVCLIDLTNTTGTDISKNFVMRKSVKAFTDTIFDLIVDTPETREKVVDYIGRKEVIYLGPDEQVIPEDINWIVDRAAKRGYDTPAAFMSSKPRAGINHKEYGVTSEGVHVFLDVALRRALDIDPNTQPFTIKITGGPSGDVAGNEIKILIREYGKNAKIVGLADHSGSVEDPDGLDHDELLRLVHDDLSIEAFDDSKLGPSGNMYRVDNEEGIKMRNTMHSRVQADAFLPAGGRPNTIDIHNYKHFLNADGTPSSPLIVEAANIFITAEAREALYNEGGVLIVKDSSANKCGVICSSYEICAAMLLSEDEFFENKQVIVSEVLEKLRTLAKMEAELLFREYESYPGSLIEFSEIISNTINVTKDALIKALEEVSEEDREFMMPLFR